MGRLVGDQRKATATHTTAGYNKGQLNSKYIRTLCPQTLYEVLYYYYQSRPNKMASGFTFVAYHRYQSFYIKYSSPNPKQNS